MRKISIGLMLLALALPAIVWSGDDPSIPKEDKAKIQAAMDTHIQGLSDKKGLPVFDHKAQAVVHLKFKELHSGVAKKGDYFVSCADFIDSAGTLYDIDLLARPSGDQYMIVESFVHKKGGEKFPYEVK